jgi:hypothetical protein
VFHTFESAASRRSTRVEGALLPELPGHRPRKPETGALPAAEEVVTGEVLPAGEVERSSRLEVGGEPPVDGPDPGAAQAGEQFFRRSGKAEPEGASAGTASIGDDLRLAEPEEAPPALAGVE